MAKLTAKVLAKRSRFAPLAVVVPIGAILFMIALAMCQASCFSPSLSRCTVRCKPGDTCPSGMVCSDDKYCHAADDSETCEAQRFDVTVNRAGQGHGQIFGRGNLNCPSMQLTECKTTASEGDYEVTAVADPDSRVLSWEIDGVIRDDCAQRDRCTFDLAADTTVGVTFGAGRTLTVDMAGRGANVEVTSQDGKISCKLSDTSCTQGYEIGTTVTLDASPGTPFFRGWSGGCLGATGSSCTLMLDTNKTVTATFDILEVQLIGVPTFGGTVTLNGQSCTNQNCILDLAPVMQTLTLFANPGNIYTLDRWVNTPCENQQPTPNPCVYTTMTDQIAIAIFEEAPFVIVNPPSFGFGSITMNGTFKGLPVNRNCVDNGTGSITCLEHFDPGTQVILKAIAAGAHTFKAWNTCPNTAQENQPQCNFPAIAGLHLTVSPTFD